MKGHRVLGLIMFEKHETSWVVTVTWREGRSVGAWLLSTVNGCAKNRATELINGCNNRRASGNKGTLLLSPFISIPFLSICLSRFHRPWKCGVSSVKKCWALTFPEAARSCSVATVQRARSLSVFGAPFLKNLPPPLTIILSVWSHGYGRDDDGNVSTGVSWRLLSAKRGNWQVEETLVEPLTLRTRAEY